MQPIRVLVVDDHSGVRAALGALLGRREEIQVVGVAEDAEAAVALNRSLRPDVIVMDLVMRGIDGIEATRRVLHDRPDVRVLALSLHEDPVYERQALAAGARAYLPKDEADRELVEAVRALAA